ncbi:MAG: YidC/Oxa1 family membrane protein insertase [Oscillibacter sp.]|nr:YidC/Oxa1 family membrane protein insertase [Oscillibacter sp.]
MFSTLGYYICIPFAWLVRIFYTLTHSYGLAIIFFTLAVKLILLPLQLRSKKSMMRMNRVSGKMQELQKKYANNQVKLNEEMTKLYEEEGVNPMSGCFWSFLPLPILIALYSIIRQPITRFMMLSEDLVETLVGQLTAAGADMSPIVLMRNGEAVVKDGVTQLTGFGQINLAKLVTDQYPQLVENVGGWIDINYNFLGLDLAAAPSSKLSGFAPSWEAIGLLLIPILAGLSQFLLSRVSLKQQPVQEGAAASSAKSMMYTMPLFSVFIAFSMPAALGVYWIAQSAFSGAQEYFMGKFFLKRMEEEEAAHAAAVEADRKRRIEEGRAEQEKRKQEQPKKQTMKEKRRAAQEARAAKAGRNSTNEAGRIGDRPYARGRSYKADRYGA